MKYLKTFESITNTIWNLIPFVRYFVITPDEFEDYFVEMVDDLNLNAKVMWDRNINAVTVKIEVPVEANSDLHGWFNENIKPRLERIKPELKSKYGLQYNGYQTGLTYSDGDQSFYYKLIWNKTSTVSKSNETFNYHGKTYAENICDEWGVCDLEDLENLFLEFADEGEVLIHPMIVNKEIKVTVHNIWKELNDSDWLYNPLWDSRLASIEKQLNKLGLDIVLETKNLNQRFVSYRIFKISGSIKESFEVVLPQSTNNIISSFGLTMDDIEELFLEFSDMGYNVRMMPSLGMNIGKDTLIVDVVGEFKNSSKTSIDPFSPETSSLVRRVIRNSTGLGLYLVESPDRMNDVRVSGKWSGCIRFIFRKR